MVITGKKIPVPGETVSGGTFLMNPGGKGANQAVAVARLSAKKGACVFIAKVSDERIRFAWMNPRDGTMSDWTVVQRTARMSFDPPTPGELLDWVLVIEGV